MTSSAGLLERCEGASTLPGACSPLDKWDDEWAEVEDAESIDDADDDEDDDDKGSDPGCATPGSAFDHALSPALSSVSLPSAIGMDIGPRNDNRFGAPYACDDDDNEVEAEARWCDDRARSTDGFESEPLAPTDEAILASTGAEATRVCVCVATCGEFEPSDTASADAGTVVSGGEYSGFADSGGSAGGVDCDATVTESVDESDGNCDWDGSLRSAVHRSQMRSTVAADAPAPDEDAVVLGGAAEDNVAVKSGVVLDADHDADNDDGCEAGADDFVAAADKYLTLSASLSSGTRVREHVSHTSSPQRRQWWRRRARKEKAPPHSRQCADAESATHCAEVAVRGIGAMLDDMPDSDPVTDEDDEDPDDDDESEEDDGSSITVAADSSQSARSASATSRK